MAEIDNRNEPNIDITPSKASADDVVCHFRFLSGTYVGSSLELHPEVYYFGNTDDCDIVCHINGDKTELKVTITQDGKVFVNLISGMVLINKNSLTTGENYELLSGEVLCIGTDRLMWQANWDSFSENWSFLSSTEVQELKNHGSDNGLSDNEQQENNSDDDNASQIQEEQIVDKETGNSQDDLSDGNIDLNEKDNSSENDSKKLNLLFKGLKIYNFCGLIILLILIVIMNWGYLFESADSNAQKSFEDYVKNYAKGKLSLDENNYSFIVSGLLPNQEVLNEFINNLPDTFNIPIELNIKLVSDLQHLLNLTFASYGITVNSVFVNDHFEVYGYIHDSILEAEIINKVENDFRRYSHVISKMKYSNDLDTRLKIQTEKFNIKADYRFGKGVIAYNGDFSLKSLDKLRKIKANILSYVNGPVVFTPYTDLSLDERAYLHNLYSNKALSPLKYIDIAKNEKLSAKTDSASSKETDVGSNLFSVQDIVGVNLKPMSFITTKNSHKYFEGGKLPDGSIIVKIESNAITVEKNGVVSVLEIH